MQCASHVSSFVFLFVFTVRSLIFLPLVSPYQSPCSGWPMGRVKNKISSRSLRLGNFTGARGSSGDWSRARRATTVAQLARRESAFVLMSRQASEERRANSSASATSRTASARPPGSCAATDDDLAEGLNNLRSRKMQDGGAEESRWKTWMKLHRRWYGNSPPLAVTVESLEKVCSLLLSGRYRSGSNYLGAAKKMHIKAGFEWSSLLELTAQKVRRALQRNLGPSKKAKTFRFDRVVEAFIAESNGTIPGPTGLIPFRMDNMQIRQLWFGRKTDIQFPHHALVISLFFLLRFIEMKEVMNEDVVVNSELKKVTLHLPHSKMDPRAKGVSVCWQCICGFKGTWPQRANPWQRVTNSRTWLKCPFHTIVDYNDRRFARVHCHEEPGFFFVGNDGKQLTLRGIVNTLTELHAEHTLHEPGPISEIVARWGGHSPRRAGAQELSRMGMSLMLI